MIEIKNLCKKYGNFLAVDDVSFKIEKGIIVGLLGPNGAGKTTIMKVLTGYHYPSSGEVKIDNLDINSDILEIKKKIGYLPENAPVYTDLRVKDYLEFIAKTRLEEDKIKDSIERVLERCEIKNVYEKRISSLSKGFKQRVCLAQAILHEPEILILDEPTSGLDPNQINDMRNLIKYLSKDKTIILSTHIMQEVEAICDRVLIINNGKLVVDEKTGAISSKMKGEESFEIEIITPNFDENSFKTISGLTSLEIKNNTNGKVKLKTNFKIEDSDEDSNAKKIFAFAVKNNYMIIHFVKNRISLEDIFYKLTKEEVKQ